MKNIVSLVRESYSFKQQIKKCLKHPVNSREYTLARYYNDYFEGLEDEEMNSAQLDTLIKECEEKRLQHQDSDEIQQLLSSILKFIEALKLVVG